MLINRTFNATFKQLLADNRHFYQYWNVIDADTKNGTSTTYPFIDEAMLHLEAEGTWTITTTKLRKDEEGNWWPTPADHFQVQPTFRWIKDDKIVDLYIEYWSPDQPTATIATTEQWLNWTGLELSMHKGPMVLSKRISRLMRPHKYYSFTDELGIIQDPRMDEATWDGSGLVSRQYIERLADELQDQLSRRDRNELLNTNRFEATVMHADGQEKAHVRVVDDLNGADFAFPAGATKTEVKLNRDFMVGLHPVHGHDHMRLDGQSLIHLYPFFNVDDLIRWTEEEGQQFLVSIESGELDNVIGRLTRYKDEEELRQLDSWYLGEYLASGGSIMWFQSTVKAIGKQHSDRIRYSVRDYTAYNKLTRQANDKKAKMRWVVPGGRYYIWPAAVGNVDVPQGHCEINHADAAVYVNNSDWNNWIVESLGGCDGDDGCWVVPFSDTADNGELKMLVWRSPNQLGEYALLTPTADSFSIVDEPAQLSSADLPTQILQLTTEYGELVKFPVEKNVSYSIEAMAIGIEQARTNQGALGAYVNALMVTKALYGRYPAKLPARLEDVIDSAVKEPYELSPVMEWVTMAAIKMAEHKPIPEKLYHRIQTSLDDKTKAKVRLTQDHWISELVQRTEQHLSEYQEALELLAINAMPPAELLEAGRPHMIAGAELRRLYARELRNGFEAAQQATFGFLAAQDNQYNALLGAATATATDPEGSDALLWQKGIATLFIAAMRNAGILGQPEWDGSKARLVNPAIPKPAVSLLLRGPWYNLLITTGEISEGTKMSDVPAELRNAAKTRIARLKFEGSLMSLETLNTDKGPRLVAYGEKGNLVGYVQNSDTDKVSQATKGFSTFRIVTARAMDGNLQAVLQAA